MNWDLLLTALGLALFIEGVAYALIPEALIKHLVAALERSAAKLRIMGLTTAVIGVGIVWMVMKG